MTLSFGSTSRAFAPLSASVSTYAVKATSLDGSILASSSSQASQTLRLAAGGWDIVVEGLSSDGRRLVSGSLAVTLEPGEKKIASIVLLPEGGNGSIALSWATSGSPGGILTISGELGSEGQAAIPLLSSGSTGSMVLEGIPAGSWRMTLAISNEGGRLAGLADSVLVVAGSETRVDVLFEPPEASLVLSLVGPSFAAESLSTLPPLRRIALATSASFEVPAGLGEGLWYRDGTVEATAGPAISFTADAEGTERVDWVSTESFTARSATGKLVVSAQVPFGPLSWQETLLRSDFGGAPEAKGLDDCRDLAFSSDESLLFLAGRDGSALGDLELIAGMSPLPRSALLAGDFPEFTGVSFVASIPGRRSALALSTSRSLISCVSAGDTGELRLESSLAAPQLGSATGLEVAKSGLEAWICSEGSNSVSRISLSDSGTPLSFEEVIAPSVPGFELLDRPTSLALSEDGAWLAIGSSGDDSIWICQRSYADGSVELRSRINKTDIAALASLSDPIDLAFSPDGGSLFVLSYYGKAVIRVDRDSYGSWAAVAAAKSGTDQAAGFDYPKHLAISPDGGLLVVSGGGTTDGLSVFDVARAGSLAWLANLLPDGTEGHPTKPGALAFSPDGRILAVASPETDALYFFARDLP